MIGQTLGRYRIVEEIGAGGMGVVYRARDERLDRDVALKVLPAGTLADEAARKRFRNEALALAKLNHPHIADVYDFDTQDGVDFLVMEYVPGQTLADKLAGGSLPEKDVAALGAQIAAALEEAHEHGVVHRDLKPKNTMLTPKGQAKVLDFGLAKLVHPASETTLSLTETHGISGTLPYMAPEQLKGEPVNPRTDIYALGIVLYEMATGQRPFREALVTRLADSILHQPPIPPRAVNPRLSPELERIILKCLEKDQENRYQSAKEAAVDLRRLGTVVSAPVVRPGVPARVRWRRALLASGSAAAVLTLLVVLNVGGWRERLFGGWHPPRIRSLAVLPLRNLSGDPEQDYFADGMTDALITEMSKIGALRVISRTSVMEYKGGRKPLREIARQLNVDAVVEGSVLRAGGRVRITAQLIDARIDRNLWAESYEHDISNVLKLQREVARAIVQEIKITLTPLERIGLTTARAVNPESYQAYLKGRFYLSQRTQEGFMKAMEYFEEAIREDPNSALAYAGLADAHALLANYGALPARVAMPKAKTAALKALELDATLAEAQTSLAEIKRHFDWDWAGAEESFRRAIALNPGYAVAHHWYGLHLSAMGRHQEAIGEIKHALNLDPLSPIIGANLAWCLYLARDYDQAIGQARKTLELFPDFAVVHEYLGQAYAEKSMFQEALAEFEKATRLSGDAPAQHPAVGYVYAKSGNRAGALRILDARKQKLPGSYVSSYYIAALYAGLGHNDQALEWLEKSYEERDGHLVNLKVHPMFDALRSEPRFQDLLRRMGPGR